MQRAVMSIRDLVEGAWEREIGWRVKLRHLLPPLGLGLLATLLMFWKLGEGSLFNWDEATYAQVAREMIWTRDVFTLHRNGALFLMKPPLFIWLTVAAYKIFGINEFAVRFWSAMSGVGVVLGTYFLGTKLYGRRVGLAAGMLLLGINNLAYSQGYNFLSLARIGHMDVPVLFMIMVAMLLGWLGVERPKYLVWMGVPLGLGMMIKNVVALFPLGGLALLIGITQGKRGMRRWQLWAGLLLAFGIALPWHVGQLIIHGTEFMDVYVSEQLLGRAVRTLCTEDHLQDAFYYLRTICRGFPFWCWLMIPALVYSLYRILKERDRSALFILGWVLPPLIMLSSVQTKIGWYVIIIYPALALMVASFVEKVLGRRYGWVFILVVMLVLNPRLPSPRDGSASQKYVASAIPYLAEQDDVIMSYEGLNDFVLPADLFYAERLVTVVSGGEQDLLDRLAQLKTGCAFVLTNTNTWHEGLPGEIVRQSGSHLLVSVCPEDGVAQ